jgi:hypothetical protein
MGAPIDGRRLMGIDPIAFLFACLKNKFEHRETPALGNNYDQAAQPPPDFSKQFPFFCFDVHHTDIKRSLLFLNLLILLFLL